MRNKAWVMGLTFLLCSCAEQNSTIDSTSINMSETQLESEQTKDNVENTVTDSSTETSEIESVVTNEDFIYNGELEGEVVFSATGGAYMGDVSLELSADMGKIYYTTDGSDPRRSGTRKEYVGTIVLGDLSEMKNVVSAVEPGLFDTAHCKWRKKTKSLECYLSAPADDVVDKCHVIKAAASSDGYWTNITSQTYFIGSIEDHIDNIAKVCEAAGQPLAVVSISINYDDLFDYNTGIYVRGASFDTSWSDYLSSGGKIDDECGRKLLANYSQRGREWEREAYVDVYEYTEDSVVNCFSQSCGIRIQGNYSRSDVQKGFRLYARKEYGQKRFEYPLFKNATDLDGNIIDSFKTLTLRNGGNCAFTTKFSDTFWQSLIGNSMSLSTKASRPAVVYLNGEYWGLYVLEEDYSQEYFKDHYSVESDDVVLYKGDAETYESGYKLDLGDAPENETEDYYLDELWSFVLEHKNVSEKKDYDVLSGYVDVQSFIDYFAVESWINNKWDWPGKNWSMWKTITLDGTGYSDGKWRLCVYDVEFGGVSGSGDASVNTIKEDNYKPKGLLDQDTKNVPTRIFALLMTNEGFRQDFYKALNSLTDNQFEKTVCENKLKEFEKVYGLLLEQFYDRYPGTGDVDNALHGGYASAQCIRDFFKKRPDYIQKMIDYCEKTLN